MTKYKVYIRIKHKISNTIVEAYDKSRAAKIALKYFPKGIIAGIIELH